MCDYSYEDEPQWIKAPLHYKIFSDSNGFCGFQPLRPCALASLRSSDLTQSRRDAKKKECRPRLLQREGGLLLSTTENVRTRIFWLSGARLLITFRSP